MLNKVHVLNANILSRITASGLPIQEVCLLHPLWTEPHQGCLPPRFLPPRPRVQWEIQTPGSLNSTHWVGSSLKVKTALSLFTDASPVPRAVPGTLPVMYHCIFLDSVCVCAQSLSFFQLCDPIDCGLPGSSVHGIFQARILEWVASFYTRGSSRPRDRRCVSYISGIGRWILLLLCHFGSSLTSVK